MRKFLPIFTIVLFCQIELWGQCSVGESEVIIETDGSAGQFNNEVYWKLYNQETGALVVETFSGFLGAGAVQRDTICLEDGIEYRFETYDTFGDGWNDAIYSLSYSDGFVIRSGMPNNNQDNGGNDDLEEEFIFTVGDRPGDNCVLPKILETDLPVLVNTAVYSNEYETNPLFDSGREAIFSFTPKVTDNYTISLSEIPNANNGSIQLFDNCYDQTPLLINNATTGTTETSIAFTELLSQGIKYFIVVSNDISSGTDTIQGNLNITYAGDPVNTNCLDAYSLEINGDSIFSRTSGGITQDITRTIETISGTNSIATKDSLFYQFNLAAQEDILIEVGDYPIFNDLFIELEKKENCGEEAETVFKRAALVDAPKIFSFEGLTAGTYRLKIYPPQFFETTFNVSLKNYASLQSSPYQNCSSALNLNVFGFNESTGPSSISPLSYFNATDSGIGVPCSQDSIFSAGNGDLWVKGRVPNSGNLIVQTYGEVYDILSSPDQALETRFSLYTGTCGSLNEFYCSEKYESHQQDTIKDLPIGQEVFVRLWDRNGDDSGFMNVRLIEPQPLPLPEISVENFTDSLHLTFTNTTLDDEFFYEVLVSEDSFNTFLPSFNPATISSSTGGFGLAGLQPAKTYYFKIFSKSNVLSNSDTITFEVETAPFIINSIANGNWSDPAIWASGTVPPPDSAVNIYHRVAINDSEVFEINSVEIIGAFEEEPNVGLWITNGRLDVKNNLRAEHFSGVPTDSVGIFLSSNLTNSARLDVGKDLVFEQADNINNEQLFFHALNNGSSIQVNVGNDFSFKHEATDSTELYSIPNIDFQSVEFNVARNLSLLNNNANSAQPLTAVFNNSTINADVFNVTAFENTNEKFQINFTGTTSVDVNFQFIRQGSGGKIKFSDNSLLTFSGLNYQEISAFGASQDSILYNNILINVEKDPNADRENPALVIMPSNAELFPKLHVSGQMTFNQGVLFADHEIFSFEEVVFSESASVLGANSSSYINGSVSKIGNTPFTFPVGHDSGVKQIRISTNDEFQLSDRVRVLAKNNFCGLSDSLLITSGLPRERTEEYWEVTNLLSNNNVSATFEPVILNGIAEGVTDFTSLGLVDFYNGNLLGNGSNTDSSFRANVEYNFSTADTARLGLSSSDINQNPFYYDKKIASLSQNVAVPGENITINLSGPFATASDKIYIGGKLANLVSNTNNSYTITVPAGSRSGKIQIIYEDDKILYGNENLTIKYENAINISSDNYANLTALQTVGGNVSLGQTDMQLGLIDGNDNLDAMIVTPDYQPLTVVTNLGGITGLQELNLSVEGNTINPTKFQLSLSNASGTPTFDTFIEIAGDPNNSVIYFENDGNGNFSNLGDGSQSSDQVYNDFYIGDINFDGSSDAVFSIREVSLNENILSGSSSGGFNGCTPYTNANLPFFEPNSNPISSVLTGNFIDNGFTDIAYLINTDSRIGLFDMFNPDTVNYYSNNSRSSDQIFEIATISLLGDGFDQIVAANQISNEIEIYSFNSGTESFDTSLVTLNFKPAKMVAEDLNGDGFQDLLVSDQDSVSIHLLLNDGTGNLNQDISFDFTNGVIADFDILDLNNDGLKDFLLLQEGGDLSIAFFETAVPQPPVIEAANITNTGFSLSWDSVANAADYEIFISLENDTVNSLATDSVFLLADTSLSFVAPEPFQTYYVFGRSRNFLQDSSVYSNSLEIQLLPIGDPEPVSSNPTSNQFDLRWPNVTAADQYEVYVGLNPDTTTIGQNDSLFTVNVDSITYQAPEYSELYYFQVRAISNSGDTSAFSPLDSIKLPVSDYLEQDSLALVAMFENTNGGEWITAGNWLSGKLNTWEGLNMTNDTLNSVILPSNNIEGVLPAEMGDLSFVNEIDLSDNSLSNISSLEPLIGSLNTLNVSANQLSFEQLVPFVPVPNFTYTGQDFDYDLPSEYFDFLGADVLMAIDAPSSSNTFQWFKDSVQISGETDSVLVLSNLVRADEGTYYVEVNNDLLGELSLSSALTTLKVSSLERDVAALRVFYDSTNGEGWSSINWDTSSDDPTEWSDNAQDVIVEDNRVVKINLAENNLTGSIPVALNDVLGLRTLNVASNALENIADLTNLPDLVSLNVSGNSLDYQDLESNITIEGFIFNNQANFGNIEDQKLPQGSELSLEYLVAGANNTYRWLRDDALISNSDSSSITIDSLTYETMGSYVLEVRNNLIDAVDPDFKLVSNPVQVIATANIQGQVSDANNFPTESGRLYLFKFQDGQEFDSVRLENGEFFVNLQAGGDFEFQDVGLDDYVLYVDNDEEEYPDLLNTYYESTIDWEFAELISLRSTLEGLKIIMQGEPEPLSGTSNLSGYLEEEFEEGERFLPRRRVSGVGASVRVLTGSSRGLPFRSILENGELVAYIETDANGEFEIPNLPAGRYSIKFDVPGVPMDESSDIIFDLTGEDQESLEIAAVSDNGVITVNRVSYTSNRSEVNNIVTVFPNPSNGMFKIEGLNDIYSIKIINSEGKLIKEMTDLNNSKKEINIDLGNYPDGMYLMQVIWKDGLRSINKLIKK